MALGKCGLLHGGTATHVMKTAPLITWEALLDGSSSPSASPDINFSLTKVT